MEDTVSLAKQAREQQGSLEAEVSYGGEADLHRHLNSCCKNPGHTKFVPVDQFCVEHLPPGCRDIDLVDLVRTMSDLTVRVSVMCVSESRPETFYGTDKVYPGYKHRGRNMLRTGTGWIWSINKYYNSFSEEKSLKRNYINANLHDKTCKHEKLNSPVPKIHKCHEKLNSPTPQTCECHEKLNSPTPKTCEFHEKLNSPTPKTCECHEKLNSPTPQTCECHEKLNSPTPKTCECHECLNSKTPKTQFAHIQIHTAGHVVFDSLEGTHTTCHLFFDKGNNPKRCNGVFALKGMLNVSNDTHQDWSWLVYVSHDLDLADMLDKMVHRWVRLTKNVDDKYSLMEFTQQCSLSPGGLDYVQWRNLTIIVSHPHGCSKQISIGYCTMRELKDDGWSCLKYTTPTCPGSSGALIFTMGRYNCDSWDNHIHIGNCEDDRAMNFSCIGYDCPRQLF